MSEKLATPYHYEEFWVPVPGAANTPGPWSGELRLSEETIKRWTTLHSQWAELMQDIEAAERNQR